jgi:hypothetical protein
VVASSRCKGDGRNEGSAAAAFGKAACRRLYPKPRGQQQGPGPLLELASSFARCRFRGANSCPSSLTAPIPEPAVFLPRSWHIQIRVGRQGRRSMWARGSLSATVGLGSSGFARVCQLIITPRPPADAQTTRVPLSRSRQDKIANRPVVTRRALSSALHARNTGSGH